MDRNSLRGGAARAGAVRGGAEVVYGQQAPCLARGGAGRCAGGVGRLF